MKAVKMRQFLLSLAGILTLSACAPTYTQQVSTHLDSRIKNELKAWEYTQKQYNETCPYGGGKEVPRAKALENTACYEELARKYVLPSAINPSAVNGLLLDYTENAIHYKKGQIDRDEAKLNGQRLWMKYANKIDSQAMQALNTASQQDALVAQQRQQAFQNLSQSVQAMEAQEQRDFENSLPKQTNCNVWNNQMNCTTW